MGLNVRLLISADFVESDRSGCLVRMGRRNLSRKIKPIKLTLLPYFNEIKR